jgi:hypothetical protein
MDTGGSVLPILTPFNWRILDCWVGVNDPLDDIRGEKRVNPKGDVYIAVSKKQKILLLRLPHHRGCENID